MHSIHHYTYIKKKKSYLFKNINCCTKRLSCGTKSIARNTDILRLCIKTKCSFFTEVVGETRTKHVNFWIIPLSSMLFPSISSTRCYISHRRDKGRSVKEMEKKPKPHHRNNCLSSYFIWWKSKILKKHEQARFFCCRIKKVQELTLRAKSGMF